MPNGRPGDHPFTDWKVHGQHPFPPDIEKMLQQAFRLDPDWLSKLPQAEAREWDRRFCEWEAALRNLESGRRALEDLISKLRSSAKR
jgi:predicted amidophosphoribosyltransferase